MRLTHPSSEKLNKEFQRLGHKTIPKPKKNWDIIWVLSSSHLDIKQKYINQRNETKDRIETGFKIAKEVTSLRLKNETKISVEKIKVFGPKIYFSGYNEHNKIMSGYLEEGYFEKKYNFPRENIYIGPQEDILHTDHQFQKFPLDLLSENQKIIIVTDAYHIPRVKRYLLKYSNKYPLNKIILYPSQPINLNNNLVKQEIGKIIKYTQDGILPNT